MAPILPYTGQEFLDSLDDGREVWIYGERVKQITRHPAPPPAPPPWWGLGSSDG